MFKEGDELKPIDYLVETGRLTNKEQAFKKLELIENENGHISSGQMMSKHC